jgi:hypothetical protein
VNGDALAGRQFDGSARSGFGYLVYFWDADDPPPTLMADLDLKSLTCHRAQHPVGT